MKRAVRFGSQRLGFVLATLLIGCGSAPAPSTSDGTGSADLVASKAAVQAAKAVARPVSFGETAVDHAGIVPVTPLLRERLSRGLGVTDNDVVVDAPASGRR